MFRKELVFVSLFFLSVMLFSLYLGLITKEAIRAGEIEPLFPSPDDFRNILLVFSLILIGTLTIIFLIKVRLSFVKVFENIAAFFLTTTTFSYFLPVVPSIALALFLVILAEIKKSYLLKNIIIFLSISSASALMGSSLSTTLVLILFLFLSIYDIISVFVTKHMVYMAQNLIERPSTFISVFPASKLRKVNFKDKTKKIKVIALGSGDYFLPSTMAVSMLDKGILIPILLSILSTVSVFLLFYFASKKNFGKPLPALPFLFLPALLAYLFSFYL